MQRAHPSSSSSSKRIRVRRSISGGGGGRRVAIEAIERQAARSVRARPGDTSSPIKLNLNQNESA